MAPGKTRPGRSLADQLAELEDPTPKDFDPEDLDRDGQSSDEETGNAPDMNAGREHYQSVGKAKLRNQEPVTLGKQYAGSHVSRDALDADSDDDPFAAHTDDDEDNDDDDVEDEQDQDTSGGSENEVSGDDASSNEDLEGSETQDDSEEEDGEAVEGEDGEVLDDEEDQTDLKKNLKKSRHVDRPQKQDDREELRKLMASDQKTIAATISQAAKADAAKGKAVKEQRATFDALLNTRIKLQKGLSAINEMSGALEDDRTADSNEKEENSETIKSAESAAIALWSTLEELRTVLSDAHSKEGAKKRKRPSPVTSATTTFTLWERMNKLESGSLPHRRSVLDKWSLKVRGTSTSRPDSGGKLLGSSSGLQTVTTVLDAQVATELGDRSSKRARPNATANGSDSTDQHQPIYDDTVFYQSLLRELVEQRMSSEAISGGLDTLQQLPSRLPIHPITGMRNDKVKRDVDTRASKGRKMRFNVHEKLQNFMAPEDRGSWTGRARDEFFASLLGKTASGLLGEGDESDSDVDSDGEREEGGLRLFRG
ncbi:Protein bfr2 [Penicillium maclennaniae]|uniref:Protein bfr2 n=1 Tax=Penicillium maclennaniae TaxID=1343394 RepID=UPI002540FFA8|nr:Protein bfr2 [Penicillium maclennaniae]KAJ5666483.1 Protein bfr2 [Penicillium maclennaniae]